MQGLEANGRTLINIDHHSSAKPFAHINWIDSSAAATAEMIFELTKAAGVPSKEGAKHLRTIVVLVDKFRAQTEKLTAQLEHASGSAEQHAKYMRDTIVPGMARLRELGDQLEVVIPHELYPLPTYREMLFVK